MRVKTLSSLVAVTGMLVCFAAQAQEAPAGGEAAPAPETTPAPVAASGGGSHGVTIGVDGSLAIPFGDWGDATGIGIGGLFRGEYPLMPNLNLTGRVGYLYHLSKNSVTLHEVPILVGAKYGFTDQIYGAAEIGLVYRKASCDLGCTSDTNLGFTIGAGYRMDALDFRLGLHILDLGHAGDSMQLVASVGYNFAAL
jgi:hypothetical protein